MSFVLKTIRATTDPASLLNAAKQIREFEEKLKPAMQCLIDYLGEKGVEIARAELIFFDDPAYYTGALSESVKYKPGKLNGVISAGEGLTNAMGIPTNYAIFVEYGTGIYGADINDHGFEGWFYPAPWGAYIGKGGKRYAWTNGMPPRPFMHNTFEDILDEVEVQGGQVIAEYIRGERA